MAQRNPGRIRRRDVGRIYDADATHVYRFAVVCGASGEGAEVAVVAAYDALWRRGRGFAAERKRLCFLLRQVAAALDATPSGARVAFLRSTCELTASQAGFVLDVPLSVVDSQPSGPPSEEAVAAAVPAAIRRRVLIRSARLLMPVRFLAVVGAVLVSLAICVLLLAVIFPGPTGGPSAATRPASRGATVNP